MAFGVKATSSGCETLIHCQWASVLVILEDLAQNLMLESHCQWAMEQEGIDGQALQWSEVLDQAG